MINDSKKNEQKDKEKREKVDITNQSESLIYEIEKNIKENDDKLDDKEKNSINEKLESLKKAKDNGTVNDIKKSIEDLNKVWSGVAAKMQQPQGEQKTKDQSSTSEKSNNKKNQSKDEIEDADFEVVD